MSRRVVGIGLTAASLLAATPARAHVELLDPMPRAFGQSEGNLKTQPCGQTANGRTDRVNVFRPGETIVVRWVEYINHQSYFRLAFELDGDDFVQRPPQNLSAVSDDPIAEENAIDIGQLLTIVEDAGSGEQSATVTLPDQECETCTLQLIQFMYGRADSYYYQCADIAIRSDGGSGTGGSGNAGGAGGVVGAGGTGGLLAAGGIGGLLAAGGTGGLLAAGGTGGLLAAGGTGGIPTGDGTGGWLATGGTGGWLAVGGTGGWLAVGGTGGVLATGGTDVVGPTATTGGAGAPLATGGAPASTGGTSFGTGNESAEPDSSSSSSGSDDDGSCSAAGPTPSRTAGLGLAVLLGLGLTSRRRRGRQRGQLHR